MYLESCSFVLLGILCGFLTYVLRIILNNRFWAICIPQIMVILSLGIVKFGLSESAVMIFRLFLSFIFVLLIVGWRYLFTIRRKV